MAGIRSDAIVAATGSERVVRAMPNTPALIGEGISGLYARDAVTSDERARIELLLEPTGEVLWVAREEDLDAVTALSGSGPAYVFFFVEAMMDAAKALRRATDVIRASLVDQPPCEHRHVAETATYPSSPSGRCALIAVCEDCGEALGQVGWDSVL